MKKPLLESLFSVCPRTGRITSIRRPAQLPLVIFPVAGFLALAWYLVRVVPKPSRATYPCQRVGAPLAGSFLIWLAGAGGTGIALRHARVRLAQARTVSASLAAAVAVAGIALAVLSQHGSAWALPKTAPSAYPPHPANAPTGTAKGFAPGRVAWAHDPKVTTWDGASTAAGQRWFEKVDQTEATNMLQWAVLGYAGTPTTSEAWDRIFRHFNGGTPYQAGEKIFIKINLTTSNAPNCANSNYDWVPSGCGATWTSIGQTPQLMVALLEQLVNVVGVAQADISIGDSTGLWVNELYTPLHSRFPNVKYVDARGTESMGRTLSVRSTTPLYWSTSEANGKRQDYLLQAVVDAKYVIDFGVLKSHERAGVTLTAKNHYGSLSGGNNDVRKPTTTNYYDLHLRLPLETAPGAWPERALMAQYRPLVDLNVHTGMSGKTVLYLLDAIYTGRGWAGVPSKWRVTPFCTHPACGTGTEFWPASLFLSMDQVAIDSVAFDLLTQRSDWTEVLAAEGVQDYLHEMALADDPPSGAIYDPERDGKRPSSQGVHEHWNSAPIKHYSRNTGTGAGIDLLYITGDPTQDAAVRRTGTAITIDGSSDPEWSAAPVQGLGRVLLGGGAISGPDDLSGSYRTLYDDENLYLLVDVVDDALVRDSATWYDDDSVVILIDGDYSRGATYDGGNDFELGFRWNDDAIARGANSAPLPPGAGFVIVETDAGYKVEVKLPVAELGIPSGYGRLFGLDVQLNDDDGGGGRDAKLAWWAQEDISSSQPKAFGPGRLEGPERTAVRAAAEGEGVRLRWTHFAWNDTYEVHKSGSPYFTAGPGTLAGSFAAPGDEYLDAAPGSAAYYLVQAEETGLSVGSNRTGQFSFSLVAP